MTLGQTILGLAVALGITAIIAAFALTDQKRKDDEDSFDDEFDILP